MTNLQKYQMELLKQSQKDKYLKSLKTKNVELVKTRNGIQDQGKTNLKEYAEEMQKAIKDSNFTKVAELAKLQKTQQKKLKATKKMTKASLKLNKLNKSNLELNKAISAKLNKMALREAKATNIVTKGFAKFQNKFAGVGLKALKLKSNFNLFKLNLKQKSTDKKFNKKVEIKEVEKVETKEANKKEILDKEKLNNYEKLNESDYKHKSKDVKAIDQGNTIKARGGDTKDRVGAMLDMAQSKKWDLSKINVGGGELFKAEMKKQIEERSRNNRKDNFSELQKMKDKQKANSNTKTSQNSLTR